MRKAIYFLFVLFLLASFKQEQKTTEQKRPLNKKLEQLHRLSPDSTIPYYDLSRGNLTKFPDLSRYTIDSLDLSHNRLDSLIVDHFPKGIKWLDVSYNCLGEIFLYGELDNITSIEKVDLSHNRIKAVGDDWWGDATKTSRRGDCFEDLLYLQSADNVAGLWILLEMPTDSISSLGDYFDKNGGIIAEFDKRVIAFRRYIR